MKVEQLLHGYHNGHHLIAGSVLLPTKDADITSYMSDWTDYVNPIDKSTSYITAYPLTAAPYYVIARSWYANEMSRPGCVWTHSLLLNLESVGAGVQLEGLDRLFRRPALEGETFDSYTKTLEVSEEIGSEGAAGILSGFESMRLLFCLSELFGRNKMQAYEVEREAVFYDSLCMRLIQFAPFGILRELSFCSGTASIRKIEGKALNLQFVNGRKVSLLDALPEDMVRPTVDKGFGFWIESMLSDRLDVAQLIHNFSNDIGNDSQKFLAVMNLLYLLERQLKNINQKGGVVEVLRHLTGEFKGPESGAKLKKSFLAKSVSAYFCNERNFLKELAVTEVSSSLDYSSFAYQKRALAYREECGIDEYLSLVAELIDSDRLNIEGQSLVRHALDGLSEEEIRMVSEKHWKEFITIASLNEEILDDDYWLDMPEQKFLALFDVFQKSGRENFTGWRKLFSRLLTTGTDVISVTIMKLKENVEDYVVTALNIWNKEGESVVNWNLAVMVMQEKEEVLAWMKLQGVVFLQVRALIKQFISLESENVITGGSECWKAFVDSELREEKDANRLTFVYQLAFRWRDAIALSYLRRVLPMVYDAIATERFSRSSWCQIERYTGKVPFWREWDYCRKLLVGVADYCRQINMSPSDVKNFTGHEKLDRELYELYN